MSGLIGGLPVTQVIVRSSANIQSEGKTKLSTITHGFFLLISVITIPALLNKIPLSVLAAILLLVGYKLAKPDLFKSIYHIGWKQFAPFITTVVCIIFTDLLTGITIGLILAILVILIELKTLIPSKKTLNTEKEQEQTIIKLAEEVTFINKDAILKELDKLLPGKSVCIDMQKSKFIDHDIIELLNDFLAKSSELKLNVTIISNNGTYKNPQTTNGII